MKTYKLTNPYVMGSMNTEFQAKSSLEAAKDAYDNLSQYFGNHMPVYRFTLKRLSNNGNIIGGSPSSFLHFEVNETTNKSDTVNYEIKKINGVKSSVVSNYQKRVNKVVQQDLEQKEQKGGAKKKFIHGTDDDDDDETSDYFDLVADKPRRGPLVYEPISYYWYDPFLYPLVDRWYVPTFVLPLQPRVVFDSHSLLYLGRNNTTYYV